MNADMVKFYCFAQDIGRGVHDLNSDVLKIVLTDTAPVVTNTALTDITQIASGNGYTTGGSIAASNTYAQVNGVAKLVATRVVFTATGAVGPFRYAVLYNNTASGKPLIGYWDYAAEVTMANGEAFAVDIDSVAGLLSVS